MRRRALLVGINTYDYMSDLQWCIDDVAAMKSVLETHEDNSPNFYCRIMLGSQTASEALNIPSSQGRVTFNGLRAEIEHLCAFDDMVLFYFSGHGYFKADGVHLVTQDGTESLPGIALNDILEIVNKSRAREAILIIDCCHSGAIGEPDEGTSIANSYLRQGVTLLSASRSDEFAVEKDGRGLFTSLVVGALKGGATDVRGQVSAASLYAYVEQALGPWDQRPIYKSNAAQLSPLRLCKPDIEDRELRQLPQFFPTSDYKYSLDPSYEFLREEQNPAHVAIFRLFKRYQVARLLRPLEENDLYFTAINSHSVELTPLGQFYWYLAKKGLI